MASAIPPSSSCPVQQPLSSFDQNDFLNNTSNPFFLYPNENPALVLVSPFLSDLNYHSWVCAMRMALLSKNKFGFINGSIVAPPRTNPTFLAWERCNTMVLSWIMCSLDSTIAQSIQWIDRAFNVWTNFRDCFSQLDVFQISEL